MNASCFTVAAAILLNLFIQTRRHRRNIRCRRRVAAAIGQSPNATLANAREAIQLVAK